jgi:hypothetical protein
MSVKKFDESVLDYFKAPEVFQQLSLVRSGEIKLHWANWDILLSKLKVDNRRGQQFTACLIEQQLEEYNNIPVWVINKQGSVETSLRELYLYFLDPRIKELWFELNEETLLSFKSPTGPFVRLQSMRWFDLEVYRMFIYKDLFTNPCLNHRSFRLTVDIPLIFTFTDSIQNDLEGRIIQISKTGMLLKILGNDIQKLYCTDEIVYSANLKPFEKAIEADRRSFNRIFSPDVFKNKDLMTYFRLKKNILNMRNNESNQIFTNGMEHYLFLHFDDLFEKDKESVKSPIIEVVDTFESYATAHLNKVS